MRDDIKTELCSIDTTPQDCTCSIQDETRRRSLQDDWRQHQQRRAFVIGLLEQQYEHQRLGMKDPKGLYQFSRAASKQSRLRAIRIAEEDARQAKEISNEEALDIIDNVLNLIEEDDFRSRNHHRP